MEDGKRMIGVDAPPQIAPVVIVVFFGTHRDLTDAVPKALERCPDTRFVCVLGKNDESSNVKWFWTNQVDPRYPTGALLLLHENRDEIPAVLTQLAVVVREHRPDTPIRMRLLLGTPGPIWTAVRQARWLRLLQKGIDRCVPDCVVERFA